MLMAYLVERLEKCLRAWEDYWFLIEAANTILTATGKPLLCPNERAVVRWSSFRKKLLKARQQPFDLLNFLAPRDKKFDNNLLAGFALPISQWCFNSRRVYHITEELQAVLNATSLEGVTWQDVSLPFFAYAIKLERPVVDIEGDYFDFIMVTAFTLLDGNQSLPAIEIHFLSQRCDQYEPLNEGNRQNIRNRIRNCEYDHVEKLIRRFLTRTDHIIGSHVQLFGRNFDEEVTVTAQRIYN